MTKKMLERFIVSGKTEMDSLCDKIEGLKKDLQDTRTRLHYAELLLCKATNMRNGVIVHNLDLLKELEKKMMQFRKANKDKKGQPQ